MRTALTSFAIVAAMFVSAGSLAQEAEAPPRKKPLEVGDLAPAVVLANLDEKEVDLAKVFKKGRTVLVVLRGYPEYQCPICMSQVTGLVSAAKAFKEAGVQVVLVFPGDADNLTQRAVEFLGDRRMRRAVPQSKLPEPFVLLVDKDYRLTSAYGLRWDAPRETAYPSTFIVSPKREVTFAKVSKEHGGRTSAQEVLKALASPRPKPE